MDAARAAHLSKLMQRNGYQALVCRMPQHVVMFTGYAPVLGNSFCLLSLNGDTPEVRLAVPAQEADLLPKDAALEVQTFTETGQKAPDLSSGDEWPPSPSFGILTA
jgi:hypothetical protein